MAIWVLMPVIGCTIVAASVQASTIIYVDDDANGLNDGSSWVNAYRYLQDALEASQRAKPSAEIRAAQGVYKPDQGMGLTPGDTWTSFRLLNDLVLKGGYAGVGTPDPNARNVKGYLTILSGDLKGNDPPMLPPLDWDRAAPDAGDNAESVVQVGGEDITIDGFVITGGYYRAIYRGGAEGSAGVSVYGNDARIINCTFMNNRAITARGGAIYVGYGRYMQILDCTFSNNYGGAGGALFNFGGSVDLYRCTFAQNRSGSSAGAIATLGGYVFSSSCKFIGNVSSGSSGGWSAGGGGAVSAEWEGTLEFEDALFTGNTAKLAGGAVFGDSHNTTLTLRNSLLIANVAGTSGGAVAGPNITLTNCTITSNRASDNPEVCANGGTSQLLNCIVWDNEKVPQQDRTEGDWLGTCSYCCIDPNVIASQVAGNIGQNPVFACCGYWDPNGTPNDPNDDFWVDGDYHLKSQGGRWDPNSRSWVQDDVTSPCIDAGDPNSDWTAEPWPHGRRINIGAYGGTAEASLSLSAVGSPEDANTLSPGPLRISLGKGVEWAAEPNRYDPNLPGYHVIGEIASSTMQARVSSLPDRSVRHPVCRCWRALRSWPRVCASPASRSNRRVWFAPVVWTQRRSGRMYPRSILLITLNSTSSATKCMSRSCGAPWSCFGRSAPCRGLTGIGEIQSLRPPSGAANRWKWAKALTGR
jgi:predicted outer membrane repeat protein